MATRSNNNPNFLEDRTSTINKIENEYGLITQLGIFEPQGITTRTFQYDEYENGFDLVQDRAWGSPRDQFTGKELVKTRAFAIPHFPNDGHIKPSDVQSRRMPGSDSTADTVSAAVARELARIRMDWSQTKEWSYIKAINDGIMYAPNGTVALNYFTEFGVTQTSVDYTFGTSTAEMNEKGEAVVAQIQDNLLDGTLVTDIVALCHPTFFANLIKHTSVKEAYKYYSGSNRNGDPLRDRLSTINGKFRTYRGGDGIMYIEYRGTMKGVAMITANEARAFPMDASGNLFKTIYAPADHSDYVNTEGQEMYAFTYELERGRGYDVETESNFANFIFKPDVLVRMFSSN